MYLHKRSINMCTSLLYVTVYEKKKHILQNSLPCTLLSPF